MKKVVLFLTISGIFFIIGCGNSSGDDETFAPSAIMSKNYTGESGSSLKVCNSSYNYYIVDVRSNPVSSSEGSNRISYDIAPGSCYVLSTSNCDQDYFLDVTYDDGNYWGGEYFRSCGYEYIFDFAY